MNCKKLLFFLTTIVVFASVTKAQVYSDRIVKNFHGSEKSTVEVFNKYGKVHVITWEKDSVKFVVDMRVSASDNKKLNKLKNNISFDFTSTNYYTVAQTKFEKSGGLFSDMVQTIIPSNNVSINYTIYIPKKVNLRIENKFGDVFIDDFSGNLGLVLSNGALKANNLHGNSSLQLNSADALINEIKSGTVTLRYSDLEIKTIDKAELNTKFSKIIVKEGDQLRITSRRDSYTLGNINRLNGSGDFTKMNVDYLHEELNFSNKYYSIMVKDINPAFNIINVSSEVTDVELRFTRGTSYNLDVTHHADVQLTYPTSGSKVETKEIDKEKKLLLTFGTIGTESGAGLPNVKIVAEKKCLINLLHK